MKKINLLTMVLALSVVSLQNANADLYVVQVGDGVAALSNASTATFVKRFDDTGMLLSTINLPTAAVDSHKPLTLSGSSTSEGFLALSTNGQYLTLGGYGVAPGTAAVPQTDSATVNRVVGRIEVSSGTVDTTTGLTDAYIGTTGNNSNIRSVASTDGTKFWSTGTAFPNTSAGVRYSEFGGTTSTRLAPAPTNTRVAKIFDGQLYTSSASGSSFGVSSVGTGLPVTEETATLLTGFPTATGPSSYDFWFKDASTLYVADDRLPASGGGIQKWVFDGGSSTWSLSYTLTLGESGFGARGLAGTIVAGNAVLFATTTQQSVNRLMMITDAGVSSTPTELAAAPTNTAFRGVAFVSTVAPPTELTGDYNDDDVVDAADYAVWRDNFGSTTADLNGDLLGPPIDEDQYLQWQANFGATPMGAGNSTAIPEPSTIALLLMAVAFGAIRRVR